MYPTAFTNGTILTGSTLAEGLAVIVDKGRVTAIIDQHELPENGMDTCDLEGCMLLPGFIDIQVNGGGGILFNDSPSIEGIAAIGAAHRRFGTSGFLPTLISDEPDIVCQALHAAEEAIRQGVPGVLGVHIEGPYLNAERRGVHDENRLRRLTMEIVGALEPISNGKTVLTLAPEVVEPDGIRELTRKGFIVCAGHTDASYVETVAALEQGLSGFTHLFNAMTQLGVREPGVVGAALDDRDSWCGIIADGHHVNPVAIRIACRCKQPDKMMLVTDAMPSVGSTLDRFTLLNRTIHVADGVCRDENGTLAGTDLDMARAVSNIMGFAGIGLPAAVQMASENPATFLGLDNETGTIDVGKRADFVVADDDLNVRMTVIEGTIYRS